MRFSVWKTDGSGEKGAQVQRGRGGPGRAEPVSGRAEQDWELLGRETPAPQHQCQRWKKGLGVVLFLSFKASEFNLRITFHGSHVSSVLLNPVGSGTWSKPSPSTLRPPRLGCRMLWASVCLVLPEPLSRQRWGPVLLPGSGREGARPGSALLRWPREARDRQRSTAHLVSLGSFSLTGCHPLHPQAIHRPRPRVWEVACEGWMEGRGAASQSVER